MWICPECKSTDVKIGNYSSCCNECNHKESSIFFFKSEHNPPKSNEFENCHGFFAPRREDYKMKYPNQPHSKGV